MGRKPLLFFALAIVIFMFCGCATLTGLMDDLSGMTPADYAEANAIAAPATSAVPFPYSEGASVLATWIVFLARNKYKEWRREQAKG